MRTLVRHSLLVFAVSAFALAAVGDVFKDRIEPFLTTYCTSCHGPEKQKGRIRVDHLTASMSDRKEAELWSRMLEAIEFGDLSDASEGDSDEEEDFELMSREEIQVILAPRAEN